MVLKHDKISGVGSRIRLPPAAKALWAGGGEGGAGAGDDQLVQAGASQRERERERERERYCVEFSPLSFAPVAPLSLSVARCDSARQFERGPWQHKAEALAYSVQDR